MKDIDLAIKEQLDAVATIPIDSPHRSVILGDLERSYSERFSHSGDVKDIDLAIKQQLEAVASVSLTNPPELIFNLGYLYLRRFQRFREVKDIGFAIEKMVKRLLPFRSTARSDHYFSITWENRI